MNSRLNDEDFYTAEGFNVFLKDRQRFLNMRQVELVALQSHVSYAHAAKALIEQKGDIVEAILSFFCYET